MRKMRKEIFTSLLAVGLFAGSPNSTLGQAAKPIVNWSEVPAAVQNAIREPKGDARITEYNRKMSNGQLVYHFGFDKNGQHVLLDIAENGTILKDNINTKSGLTKVEWSNVPPAVRRAVDAQKGNAPVQQMETDVVNGQTIYRFAFMKNGMLQEVSFYADGSSTLNAAPAVAATPASGSLLFKDLPWTVQKPMLDQTGYANIERVDKISMNGKTVYVGHYTKDGRTHQIRVAEDGTIVTRVGTAVNESAGAQTKPAPLSGGTKVNFDSLPDAVKNTIKAQAGGAAIEDIDKGTLDGRTVYEAAFKKDGRTFELRVNERGQIVGSYFD
jgi:uncharacterized membrane protein YkoI